MSELIEPDGVHAGDALDPAKRTAQGHISREAAADFIVGLAQDASEDLRSLVSVLASAEQTGLSKQGLKQIVDRINETLLNLDPALGTLKLENISASALQVSRRLLESGMAGRLGLEIGDVLERVVAAAAAVTYLNDVSGFSQQGDETTKDNFDLEESQRRIHAADDVFRAGLRRALRLLRRLARSVQVRAAHEGDSEALAEAGMLAQVPEVRIAQGGSQLRVAEVLAGEDEDQLQLSEDDREDDLAKSGGRIALRVAA